VAAVGIVLLLGAFALERASRSWVPDAERRVRAAQQNSSAAGSSTPANPAAPAVSSGDPLASAAAKAAASPQDPELQLEYARQCAEIGAFMRALRPAETAARLQPANAETQMLLGMLYASQGYLPQAELHYRKSIELDSKLMEAYLRYGLLLHSMNRAAEEESLYRKAMTVGPDMEGPRISLAGLLADKNKHDEAVALLEPILSKPDPNPAVLMLAAKSLQARGRVDRAEELTRKLVISKPDLADAHHLLGSLLANRGAGRESIDELQRACDLAPDDSTHWYALGNAFRGDVSQPDALNKAAQAFERSLEVNPAFPFAHYFYGLTLEDLGDREGAIREYRRTLELQPEFGSARHRLGAAYKAMGRTAEGEKLLAQFAKEARGAIDQVHGGRRDNSFVDTAQAQADRGIKFLQSGDRARAITAFKNALQRDPQNGLARRQLRMLGELVP
jgi:tetratricopeptide (TPR) repeat protein